MKKNINRIAFFNFLSILLLQGISFISSPLFSRLLGTEGYGNLASFSTWAGIAVTVLSLQTNATIVNAMVEFPEEEQPAYQASAMMLSILSFAVGSLLVMLLSGPISAGLKMQRWLLGLLLVQAFGTFGRQEYAAQRVHCGGLHGGGAGICAEFSHGSALSGPDCGKCPGLRRGGYFRLPLGSDQRKERL